MGMLTIETAQGLNQSPKLKSGKAQKANKPNQACLIPDLQINIMRGLYIDFMIRVIGFKTFSIDFPPISQSNAHQWFFLDKLDSCLH